MRALPAIVDESLYFANARQLEERIYALAAARPSLARADAGGAPLLEAV